MAITEIKIHPAIGIARVGNSPDEWFIGPETADLPEIPAGGYKDAECRIKREAARFRLFAYHDDGPPTEMTSADAVIVWTVEVANKKATSRNDGVDASLLTIAPGPRSVEGPNAQNLLTGGTIEFPPGPPVAVDLGEIRTDADGRLIVLGGFGRSDSPNTAPLTDFENNSGWYDDVSDGSVNATVTIGTTTRDAKGAWVIVAPPDFAPTIRPAKSLYDRLHDHYRAVGLFGIGHHDPVLFRRHIHPILQTAVQHRAVHSGISALDHSRLVESLYPMTAADRSRIVARFEESGPPRGTMPPSYIGRLTETQLESLRRWRDGHPSFVDDWATPPTPLPIAPAELDRGPLSHAIGDPLNPGFEAGESFVFAPGLPSPIWSEPFRIDPTPLTPGDPPSLSPGDVTRRLAVPWQADFYACQEVWWPSHRPGHTTQQATGTSHDWTAGVGSRDDMVDRWHTLGFVVPQGSDLVEVERCATAYITLLTPVLDFVDVPQGPSEIAVSRALPIHFEVVSPAGEATLRIVSGAAAAPFSRVNVPDPDPRRSASVVIVGPTVGAPDDAYLWIRYTTEAVGPAAPDSVVIEHVETGRRWTVELRANTVGRTTTAVALVLDRSGSMSESRGDGTTKLASMKEAASMFVDLAHEGDGIGAVRYNADVDGEIAVQPLGSVVDPLDPARGDVKAFIGGLSASGGTSIGDGIERGREILGLATTFGQQAMVVITDGKETSPKWISEVADTIDSTTFGIGIGTAANVDAATLQALSGNSGGYLLVTGPIVGDTQFILMKYFLQILAGISNAEVLLDPEGHIGFGEEVRIPFAVSDADHMLDVVMLSPAHQMIDLRIETPLGNLIVPSSADADHVVTDSGEMVRFKLPLERVPGRIDHAGTWTAVLSVSDQPEDDQDDQDGVDGGFDDRCERRRAAWRKLTEGSQRGLAPYSVIVNVYSDVSLKVGVRQGSTLPGGMVDVHARLTHSGAPFAGSGGAFAEITGPSGAQHRVDFVSAGDGRFSGSFAVTDAGVHRVRVRSIGETPSGWRFDREQTHSAVVAVPVPPHPASGDAEHRRWWCDFLTCVSEATSGRFGFVLKLFGINVSKIESCRARWCDGAPTGDET